uniref:TSA: Wollemia nobilis Ref_Wollemi_Transcript_6001_1318 transcribed RNA sequence n=1 Tax=Wollemia nobilis TaxID=56998 RepID=A0A0C9S841_9CONI
MAFKVVKSVTGFLLFLNFCMYVIVAAIAGWALNKALNHHYLMGAGGVPVGFMFSPVAFPMGNAATGFLVIFALIAGVVGAGSCLSGLHHIRVWTAESLASSASSAMTSWALTLLAMGLACKEIHIGGRSSKLIALESFLIILAGTELLYIMLIHGGFFGGKYMSYRDTYVTTTTAEPHKGSGGAASSAV